ncbi:hypothetical protein Tco_1042581 [Tanacetum coccineum]|uniref:LSM domain-containing protein n=1 Tax=Tanacetum coccineum TaxID=301880 RepID=A0ABQ5GJJ3_9ASTR
MSALRRSDNENMLSLMNLIIHNVRKILYFRAGKPVKGLLLNDNYLIIGNIKMVVKSISVKVTSSQDAQFIKRQRDLLVDDPKSSRSHSHIQVKDKRNNSSQSYSSLQHSPPRNKSRNEVYELKTKDEA